MVIYIEVFMIINSMIHYFIYNSIKKILSIKISNLNFFTSLIALNFYLFFYIEYGYLLKKYVIYFGIIFALFLGLKKDFNQKIKIIICYYLFNFLLGGLALYLYNISLNLFYIIILMLTFLMIIDEALFKSNFINLEILHYNLKIKDYKDNIFMLNSYLDTGNFLFDDDNIPIVILQKKYEKILKLKYKKSFSINTISTNNTLKIYEVKAFYVLIENIYVKKEVYIGFGQIKHQAIVGLAVIN